MPVLGNIKHITGYAAVRYSSVCPSVVCHTQYYFYLTVSTLQCFRIETRNAASVRHPKLLWNSWCLLIEQLYLTSLAIKQPQR